MNISSIWCGWQKQPRNQSSRLPRAMTDIEAALREVVRSRAAGLCEYCRILERFTLALIGGYAVGIYGHIRATNALDI